MLEVRTGCRLHFGLMELATDQVLRFGGLGLMLDQPGWQLRFSSVPPTARHEPAPRQAEWNARVDQVLRRGGYPSLSVLPLDTLPLHSGLGAGTQLACAVAVGQVLVQQMTAGASSGEFPAREERWTAVSQTVPELTPRRLAELSGRGLRSAVGLYGFLTGGLVLDQGYPASGPSRPVVARAAHLPEPWRVVLIAPSATALVSGDQEAAMLRQIGSQPNPHRDAMHRLGLAAQECLRTTQDFGQLMELLEAYMALAAELFAGQQGGQYNGAEVARAAHHAQRVGLRGVGQSSWGPTVFGFAPEHTAAEQAAQALQTHNPNWTVTIARPARRGAQWRAIPGSSPT